MESLQDVLRNIVVPERRYLVLSSPLFLPLFDESSMDYIDDLYEKCAGAGGGVENLDERLVVTNTVRDREILIALRHLAPRGRVGEAVFETVLGTQQLINRANDVRNVRTGRVKNAALH